MITKWCNKNIALVLLSSCTLMTGCSLWDDGFWDSQAANQEPRIYTAESILAAEGIWAMFEDEQNTAYDPIALHKQAKTRVNPNDRSKKQFVPEERVASAAGRTAGQDVHYRVIRIEPEFDIASREFDLLLPPKQELIVADMSYDEPRTQRGAVKETLKATEATTLAEAKADEVLVEEIILGGTQAKRIRTKSEIPATHRPVRKPSVPIQISEKQQQRMAKEAGMKLSAAQALPRTAPVQNTLNANTDKIAAKTSAVDENVTLASVENASVKNMRTGMYTDKMRLVLDLTGESAYKVDVDNSQKTLKIDLPQASWNADAQARVEMNDFISGYTAEDNGKGGTTLVLALNEPVRVIASAALKPNSSRGHRIYMDLKSLS